MSRAAPPVVTPARSAAAPVAAMYGELLDRHGPQGWWPLFDAGHRAMVYRPGDYAPPPPGRWAEIAMGAILTQNTAWTNVVRAMEALHDAGALDWAGLMRLPDERIEALIRPAGYFRQKTRKLRAAAAALAGRTDAPRRHELLAIWGVGPETADSMLLYACGEPVMVVDAYLRRVLAARGFVAEAAMPYERLRAWVEAQLPPDAALLNELHALVVAEAKRISRR